MSTKEIYRKYIDCLNSGSFDKLSAYVHERLVYNSKEITLEEYRAMLLKSSMAIPDLFYKIDLLVTDEDTVACRINFDCTPVSEFMGIVPNGNRIIFSEHVFYRITKGKISEVWSLIDKDAVREQL